MFSLRFKFSFEPAIRTDEMATILQRYGNRALLEHMYDRIGLNVAQKAKLTSDGFYTMKDIVDH